MKKYLYFIYIFSSFFYIIKIGDNMQGLHLQSSKKKLSKLKSFIHPNMIYIPIDNDCTVYVKKNEYVYKGTVVAKTKGNFVKTFFSSVSGFVEDITKIEEQKYIVIKNDGKEKIETKVKVKNKISDYTKHEFIQLLKDNGIVGMGGAGFPTYVKYENEDLKTLVVNAVECEPYISADYALVKEKIEEILLCIDAIIEINHLEKAVIAIKKNNKDLKKIIETYIGTYDRIQLIEIPTYYPMGWERNVVKATLKENYDVLPSEKGIVVNNISTIYAIYQALKFQKPLIERVITITGNMVKNPCNILVKIGTNMEELLSQVSLKRNDDVVLYLGGPMMGNAGNLNSVVTATVNAVMIDAKKEYEEIICLRCSKCVKKCPVHIEPVLIKDALNHKEELVLLHPERCIECGICSFVCPAKINLREKVREAKETIRRQS